ncbi:MAG TPA: TetR/AcrR family transcriptional regulator [Sandaracinaceae bacterium LLY-WYZ-13_1]|nr:TetR/AcrR family transcriptional regulator [Sandaracinaceae bacterium LLY-WYZ-13_1]
MTARLRKKPVQARSRRRFEAMLDAAAELFAREGLEGTTMDAIASRAGTSIGSLYQYFPDKEALFFALAERVLERSRAVFDALVPAMEQERPPWTELVDRAVEGFAAVSRDASVRAVWMHLQRYGQIAEADAALHEELIERSAVVVGWYAPHLAPAELRRVATMTVDVIGAVLFMSTLRGARHDETMLAELRRVLRRYLRPYLDGEGREP